jgi:hypothetical protein
VPSEFAALGGKVVRRPVYLASEKSAGEGTEHEEYAGKEEEEGEGGGAYDSDEEQWDEIMGAGGSGESSDFTTKGTSKATLGAKKGRDERQGRVKWSEKEVHWLREGVAAYGEGKWAQIREFCDPFPSTIHFVCGECMLIPPLTNILLSPSTLWPFVAQLRTPDGALRQRKSAALWTSRTSFETLPSNCCG